MKNETAKNNKKYVTNADKFSFFKNNMTEFQKNQFSLCAVFKNRRIRFSAHKQF